MMTPFGRRVRELRSAKGVSQKEMAAALGVSAAYVSALEKGQRGAPSWDFVQRVINYFNVIWDDAEELQVLAVNSNPKVAVDTRSLGPNATEMANYLAKNIHHMSEDDCAELVQEVAKRVNRNR